MNASKRRFFYSLFRPVAVSIQDHHIHAYLAGVFIHQALAMITSHHDEDSFSAQDVEPLRVGFTGSPQGLFGLFTELKGRLERAASCR